MALKEVIAVADGRNIDAAVPIYFGVAGGISVVVFEVLVAVLNEAVC